MQEPKDGGAEKIKVAIVGGGCAGLTAAWELAGEPGYEVHVFERSWRLGGKGASGRDEHGRILEHGLHIWLGFYDNAFRLIRACYDEAQEHQWGPEHADPAARLAHASFKDAFFPEPHIGVAVGGGPGDVAFWSGLLPPAPGMPGDERENDSDDEITPYTLASYFVRTLELLKTLMLSVIATPAEDTPGRPRSGRSASDEALDLDFSVGARRSRKVVIDTIMSCLRAGTLTATAVVLQTVAILEAWVQNLNHSPQVPDTALNVLEAVAAQIRKQLRDVLTIDQKLRWKTEVIDIVMAIVVGLYRDRVLFERKGLDSINQFEYREWLFKHGATKSSLASPFLAGIYDLVFAYSRGDRSCPRLAAGVALRGAFKMFFGYRGAMFWRMRSGMGDAVFAPLYKSLAAGHGGAKPRSAVHFHFLHELAEVGFTRTGSARCVQKLVFDTVSSALVDDPHSAVLDHLGCWPNDSRLLVRSKDDARPRRVSLEIGRGKDFQFVVMAMGGDDFFRVCEGADPDAFYAMMPPSWKVARNQLSTVATKAAQVWLKRDLEGLGWYRGPVLLSALGLKFQTWADMTHTLATEKDWRNKKPKTEHAKAETAGADEARSVAYFCSVMSDQEVEDALAGGGAAPVESQVENDLKRLLKKEIKPLWSKPFAKGNSVLDPDLRAGAWHVQANYLGSDRYSLSLPGSIEHRLSPLDPAIRNMTVAGDWTACSLDAGCVEAAVMSGKLAALALTGINPSLTSITGYDHP